MKRLALLFCLLPLATAVYAKDITIENDQLTVRIRTLGVELQSIQKKATGREYLWHGDPEYWPRRAPIMFPVIVRFKDNTYTYQGRPYHMPDLGLVHDAELSVTHQCESEVTFTLESNERTLKHYPFNFRFNVTYRLEGSKLINEFKIENLGDETMYFALAGHPGFVLPKPRSDCEVTFSEPMTTDRPVLDEGLIQEQRLSFLNNDSVLGLTDPRVPDYGMLFVARTCNRIGIAEQGQAPFIEVDFGDFPNTNLWTPNGKPFVCPEPLIGHHDSQETPLAIEEKDFLAKVAAQSSKEYQFTIVIH